MEKEHSHTEERHTSVSIDTLMLHVYDMQSLIIDLILLPFSIMLQEIGGMD